MPTLEELLSNEETAQLIKGYAAEQVEKEKNGLVTKNKEVLEKLSKANKEKDELLKKYDGIDLDFYQKVSADEEAKLRITNPQEYDAKLAKRIQDTIEAEKVTPLMNKLAEKESALSIREEKVLNYEARVSLSADKTINQDFIDDIILLARANGWTLDANSNLVKYDKDGHVERSGKDGTSPLSILEWGNETVGANGQKRFDKYRIAIGGVGANGNTKAKLDGRTMLSTDFNSLSPTEQMKFIKEKGKVIY